MTHPLALPIFNRFLTDDQKFDLLFGRATVLLGLDLDKFIQLASSVGVKMCWVARKEAGKLVGPLKEAISVGGQVLLAEKDGRKMVISGGLLLRILMHGTTPRSAIDIVSRCLDISIESRGGL